MSILLLLLLLLFKVSFLDCFFTFCEGGGCCCIFGIGVCFLCVLCSFCWEETLSVYCDGTLHSSCKPSLSFYEYFFFGSVEELRSILSLLLVSHSCLVVRIIFSWTPFTFWGLLLSQNIFFVVGPLNCKLLALS